MRGRRIGWRSWISVPTSNADNWNFDVLCHRRGEPTDIIDLEVAATPYFEPGYLVGLTASWSAFPDAVEYRVIHFREDECGVVSETVTTTELAADSGLHVNCGAPEFCSFRQVTVQALDASGAVLGSGFDSFCEVGNAAPTVPGAPTGLFVNPGEGHLTLQLGGSGG